MRIEEGHYGGVDLSGLCWVVTFKWPGAVHEGNGEFQCFIESRATEEQRAALIEILHGRASEDGTDFLAIFASTVTKAYEPVFAKIEFECDVESRNARIVVPGVIESIGTPMIDPFSGEPHDVRLQIPNGMEFTDCYCGSGTSKATGDITLDHADSWGQFAIYHLNQSGVVR
jgi:hypothetical protein